MRHLLPQRPAPRKRRAWLVDFCAARQRAVASSQPAMQAIERHLAAGVQVIVFLESARLRALAVLQTPCGWWRPALPCDRADTAPARRAIALPSLRRDAPVPKVWGKSCGTRMQILSGQGPERGERLCVLLFSRCTAARLDLDTATGRGALEAVLERVHRGEARNSGGTANAHQGAPLSRGTILGGSDAPRPGRWPVRGLSKQHHPGLVASAAPSAAERRKAPDLLVLRHPRAAPRGANMSAIGLAPFRKRARLEFPS